MMKRILSTYVFRNQRLSTALLSDMELAGITHIELFCAQSHFDYRSPQVVRELADWLDTHDLKVHSVHSPTSREMSAKRENSIPISLCDLEHSRRLDAVDEVKHVLEIAERIPFRFLVQHLGASREAIEPRRHDAAMNSLEHLCVFAKQRGVTIALENTPGEFSSPAHLREFIVDTHLRDLRLCFDTGHAHLEDGVEAGFDAMRDFVATTHIHDNHGERDEHLFPYSGTIDWGAALRALRSASEDLPLVLEVREQAADSQPLERATAAFVRLEGAGQ
jgi:sugar phosphate isomerase/epimerase